MLFVPSNATFQAHSFWNGQEARFIHPAYLDHALTYLAAGRRTERVVGLGATFAGTATNYIPLTLAPWAGGVGLSLRCVVNDADSTILLGIQELDPETSVWTDVHTAPILLGKEQIGIYGDAPETEDDWSRIPWVGGLTSEYVVGLTPQNNIRHVRLEIDLIDAALHTIIWRPIASASQIITE